MRKNFLGLMAYFVCAFSLPAHAGYFNDGNWLHSQCQEDRVGCHAYVTGVIDGTDAVSPTLYCWPENAKLGQAVDVVKKWLEDNPAIRNMSGSNAVISALKEAFPTKVMWMPPQENADGSWASIPLTVEKSTERGEWVASCGGEYAYGSTDIMKFGLSLPDNYEAGKLWFRELWYGPQ